VLEQDAIDQARAVPISSVLAGHPLRRSGGELIGACPVCGGSDRFGVNLGKNIWNCRQCCRGGDAIDLLQHLDGCDFRAAVELLAGTSIASPRRKPAPAAEAKPSEEAARLWREAVNPMGTPVEVYLQRREVTLPGGVAGDAIKFHPSCKFGLKRVPCMLALVRNIRTDVPQAIHRTALDRAGNKISLGGNDRMSLGPVADGAVKLTDDAEVSTCLGIGEGIESTLSLRLIPEFGASPVWSLLTAGGIKAFRVLPGIECLWIAVDHDAAGERAAATCAQRWTAAGQEVFRVRPEISGDDLNDLIKSA
jgi:hypothetical protein